MIIPEIEHNPSVDRHHRAGKPEPTHTVRYYTDKFAGCNETTTQLLSKLKPWARKAVMGGRQQ